jgi:tetratricopeptide (TPR) repeat protein
MGERGKGLGQRSGAEKTPFPLLAPGVPTDTATPHKRFSAHDKRARRDWNACACARVQSLAGPLRSRRVPPSAASSAARGFAATTCTGRSTGSACGPACQPVSRGLNGQDSRKIVREHFRAHYGACGADLLMCLEMRTNLFGASMSKRSPTKNMPTNEAGFAPAPPWRRTELRLLSDADEALSLVLWRALRDVRLYAESPPEERNSVFPGKAPSAHVRERNAVARAQAPELEEALEVFGSLPRNPAGVSPDQLGRACIEVVTWADTRGLLETAQQFAEAAAAVEPHNPAYTNVAGRICRIAADNERAYQWYARAASLARTRRYTDEYIRAHLGAGALFYHQGQYARARRHWIKGAQRAQSRNRRAPAAEARHDLLTLEMEIGTYSRAEAHARAALELYPLRHPQFPALGIDFSFLLVRNDLPYEAIAILREAGPLILRPQVQVAYWGVFARAAARAGDREHLREGDKRVGTLTAKYGEFAAAATLNVGEGAWLLREWETAERCGARAAELASARADSTIAKDAFALLDRVAARVEPPKGLHPPTAHDAPRLAGDLIRRLRMARQLRESARPIPDDPTGSSD